MGRLRASATSCVPTTTYVDLRKCCARLSRLQPRMQAHTLLLTRHSAVFHAACSYLWSSLSSQGIFVRPTSFDVISFPEDGQAVRGSRVKSAPVSEVSDDAESLTGNSLSAFSKTGSVASYAASVSAATTTASSVKPFASSSLAYAPSAGRKSGGASPVTTAASSASSLGTSSPRRSSSDVYGYGAQSAADSEPPSPDGHRSSTSSPRPFEPPPPPLQQQSSSSSSTSSSGGHARRLSPRRRTSALVSSIDDVLASMEYAASDINRKAGSGSSSRSGSGTRTHQFKSSSKDPKTRPKSPFERSRMSNYSSGSLHSHSGSSRDGGHNAMSSSIYSSEEERLFVENLVELVGSFITSKRSRRTRRGHRRCARPSNGDGAGACSPFSASRATHHSAARSQLLNPPVSRSHTLPSLYRP